MITNMEEVSSSSAQRAASPFKEVGWRRSSGLQRIQILCDVAKGRASDELSPSPDQEKGVGVTTRPHESTPCGPPHGHGTLDGPGHLRHPVLPCDDDLQAVLRLNCSSSGDATQAAVSVLYLFCTLSVMILTAQSLVPVECCWFFQCSKTQLILSLSVSQYIRPGCLNTAQ